MYSKLLMVGSILAVCHLLKGNFKFHYQTIELFGNDSYIELTLKYNIQQGENSKVRLYKISLHRCPKFYVN